MLLTPPSAGVKINYGHSSPSPMTITPPPLTYPTSYRNLPVLTPQLSHQSCWPFTQVPFSYGPVLCIRMTGNSLCYQNTIAPWKGLPPQHRVCWRGGIKLFFFLFDQHTMHHLWPSLLLKGSSIFQVIFSQPKFRWHHKDKDKAGQTVIEIWLVCHCLKTN